MDEVSPEEEPGQGLRIRAMHIKKRALKNKALSVSFNEKDLNDYVSGFHKRKKKRRKEAQQQLEEAKRLKRIEERKKRKLERDYVLYGGAEPVMVEEPDEELSDGYEEEEKTEQTSIVSGTTMYDNSDVKVTVTTREISHKEGEDRHSKEELPAAAAPRCAGASVKKSGLSVSKKKGFKKVGKRRSHQKPRSKRDKMKKGKKSKTR